MLQATAVFQVAIALAAVSGGDKAVSTVADSLALLEARQRIEHPRAPDPQAQKKVRVPSPEAIAANPTALPPASAGSNGTHVPHSSSLGRDQIFAHRRGGSGSRAILLTGVALAPTNAPEAVEGAVDAANTIVGRPYVWGGGHASFYSNSYDCSGAVSFALFGGGLIPRPLTSGELMHWGAPGPGRWITVYASPGHAFAEIAGLRFDTVGDEQGTGPRWHLATASTVGFVARHPPGL